MEKILEKLFDIKKIPTKLIFVLWLSASLILFVPEQFLTKLNLNDFLQEYGKYIGIIFIIGSGFLLVALMSSITRVISRKKMIREVESNILKTINYLDFHEKALLREFFINGKNTLQLPFDNDTVVGLINKHVQYQASDTGFTYVHGAYFPYSITEFARRNLTNEMIDFPQHPTEIEKQRILNDRPAWAKERSRIDNLFNLF